MTPKQAIAVIEDYGYQFKAERVLWDEDTDTEATHYLSDHVICVGASELLELAEQCTRRQREAERPLS